VSLVGTNIFIKDILETRSFLNGLVLIKTPIDLAYIFWFLSFWHPIEQNSIKAVFKTSIEFVSIPKDLETVILFLVSKLIIFIQDIPFSS